MAGKASLRICSRLATSSTDWKYTPVTLAAGRDRLLTLRHRIVVDRDHHDRQGARAGDRRLEADLRSRGDDDVGLARDYLAVARLPTPRIGNLDVVVGEVVAFAIAELGHAREKGLPLRRR